MDQPGKVANTARGQLNRENNIPLSPCVPENLVSRDRFSRPVPRQPAHLHTQAESGAYLRDSSRVPRRRPFMKPSYATGSVPSLSGHANAYRRRSLPRVHRHRASKPQGSSERVLPWQITMDQLIFDSLSHTHYWYVGLVTENIEVHRPKAKYEKNTPLCLKNCKLLGKSVTHVLPQVQGSKGGMREAPTRQARRRKLSPSVLSVWSSEGQQRFNGFVSPMAAY